MHLSEMFSTAPTNYKHICQTAVSKHQSYITICIGQYFIFEKKKNNNGTIYDHNAYTARRLLMLF